MKRILSIISLLFFCMTAIAQNFTVRGTVFDNMGTPVAGAYVVDELTKTGVNTDENGKYEITVGANSTLSYSFMGFKTLSQKVSGGVMDVRLEPDSMLMDELVVIGYGTVKREEITSSITRVKSEDFVQGGVSSPMQLLQGKVAGLGISNTTGDPAGDISVQLRGISTLAASSSPLIVIDGIVGGSLNSIAQEDIESIDVLKDGSAAAIYGTRGTNGVILITTRRPKEGAMTLEYDAKFRVDQRLRDNDCYTADELRTLRQQPEFSAINDFGGSTDWVKEITRVPFSHSHYVSARGGNGRTGYVASLTYDDRQGLYKTSFQKSLAAKVSINHSMFDDRLKFILNVNDRAARRGNAADELYSTAVLRNPTTPIYNEDGSYYENSNGANPVELLNEYEGLNKYNQLSLSAKIVVEPIKNLKLSATGAYQNDYNEYEWTSTHKAYNAVMGSENGSATLSGGHGDDRTLELQADWSKTFGNHSLSTTLGYSWNRYIYQNWKMYAFDFPVDGFGAWNIGSAESTRNGLSNISSLKTERKLIGFYGRVNYNYAERYLLMVSARYEGSDKFGKNNRWGWFPSVSAGWRITNEEWMKSVNWIDELKLRAGYGVTGTEPSAPYQYIALYDFNNSYMSYVNGHWVSGIIPANNPNDDLKWEEKHEANVGLDFAFLGGRLSGSLDGYYRYTKDLLYTYTVPMPPNIASSMLANVGAISNSGVEFSLNGVILQKKDFSWTIGGNISYNRNRLEKLSNDNYTLEYLNLGWLDHVQTYSHRLEEGWAIGNFYGWETVGLKSNGTAWRIKGAENSTAGEDQKTVLGNGMPKMFAALSTTLRWKGLDFSVSMHGAFLYQILNQYRMKYETLAWLASVNVPKSAFEKVGDYYNYAPSTYCDRYIENGNYMKLDNITLGYTFNFPKVRYIDSLRLYFAGQNLLTMTKYRGLDPEAVSITGLIPGVDAYEKYPTLRSFTFGINLKF